MHVSYAHTHAANAHTLIWTHVWGAHGGPSGDVRLTHWTHTATAENPRKYAHSTRSTRPKCERLLSGNVRTEFNNECGNCERACVHSCACVCVHVRAWVLSGDARAHARIGKPAAQLEVTRVNKIFKRNCPNDLLPVECNGARIGYFMLFENMWYECFWFGLMHTNIRRHAHRWGASGSSYGCV